MANRLPIPPELQHLIEKRETADRRRGRDRRGAKQPPTDSAGDASGDGQTPPATEPPVVERRTGQRRRKQRRKAADG